MPLRILYRDDSLVAVDKPAGFHVHPPENAAIRINRQHNCLAIVRDQLGQLVYPVHRLDVATSGVLLYALSSKAAGALSRGFAEGTIEKSYYCVVRGWVEGSFELSRPLSSERDPSQGIPALTRCRSVARLEIPKAVGRYATARYSLVEAMPVTGRTHQIRRHLSGHSHPILGDRTYGDGAHNRFFRDEMKLSGMFLKCQALGFRHPVTEAPLLIRSRWTGPWHRVFDLFGVCPFSGK